MPIPALPALLWTLLTTPQAPAAPDACALLGLDRIGVVLGRGWRRAEGPPTPPGTSRCEWRRGASESAVLTVTPVADGDARAALGLRQAGHQRLGRSVTPLPTVCDGAFAVEITATSHVTTAARRTWLLDAQVRMTGRPNASAERSLLVFACQGIP